jgi:hypothetical protein
VWAPDWKLTSVQSSQLIESGSKITGLYLIFYTVWPNKNVPSFDNRVAYFAPQELIGPRCGECHCLGTGHDDGCHLLNRV